MSDTKETCSNLEKLGIIALVGGFALIMVVMFYNIHQSDLRDQARHKMYQDACKALDVRLGDSLEVKTGPYRGIEMIAIRFGEETIEVFPIIPAMLFVNLPSKVDTTMRFTCDDLQVLKKRVDNE